MCLFFDQYGGHLFREVGRVKVSRWYVCGRLGGAEWYVSSRERTEVTFRTPSGLHDILVFGITVHSHLFILAYSSV